MTVARGAESSPERLAGSALRRLHYRATRRDPHHTTTTSTNVKHTTTNCTKVSLATSHTTTDFTTSSSVR